MINIYNRVYAEQLNYMVIRFGLEDLIMPVITILCHMKLDSFVKEVTMTTIMGTSFYIVYWWYKTASHSAELTAGYHKTTGKMVLIFIQS